LTGVSAATSGSMSRRLAVKGPICAARVSGARRRETMKKLLYTLLSGETVEVGAPGEVGTFLRRVLAAAAAPSVSAVELDELVHSPENPLLDKTVVPGRAVATAEVYQDPIFHVMLDCIARKRMSTSGPVAPPPVRYTMTVPEAAKQLQLSESGV